MKIAVLLSGGVDSSVALRLLQDEGHDLTAFYLKVWLEDELDFLGACPWEEDVEYAREVCDQANIPLTILPMQQDYRERILSYTLAEIQKGYTPNPDIMCNNRFKFGAFQENIDSSFEKVATGHYASVVQQGDLTLLKTTPDPIKDQTYFLAHLTQAQLARAVFPIGVYQKSQVRELAEDFALPNRARPDSQGLCFLGKISFADFIKHHLGESPGDIIEVETGEKIGEHKGYWFHTIGQRRGLGLSGGPWYVTAKDTGKNIVYISRSYFSEEKERNHFEVERLSWTSGRPPEKENLRVKIRHGAEFYNCQVEYINTKETELQDKARLRVRLEGRDQGLAPGQFAVFYDDEYCLGCGVIRQENPAPVQSTR